MIGYWHKDDQKQNLNILMDSNYTNFQDYDKIGNGSISSLNESYFGGKAFVYSGFSKQLAYLKVH